MTKNVGFIGLGIMGAQMAAHIQKAGYALYVYTRSKAKANDLIQGGARWCDSPMEVAKSCQVIFTIVGFPQDVREIYFGNNGLIENTQSGAILCDMTTSEPALAIEIAKCASPKNIHVLDAPVSGGDTGAKNATLSIMVGGEKQVFEQLLPLLKLMGKNIVYQGESGCGQHCKMCNQIVIAGTMMGMIEALRYAKESGLCQQQLLAAISKGAAGSWSLDNLAPRIVNNDTAPGFLIKHFLKDMEIAAKEAQNIDLNVPVLQKAIEYYKKAVSAGGENMGTQGLYALWEQNPQW
ncbi:NAD(P)-dependent oxidoreductase [Candidatus Uabimicrobium sp. HlEnr_7]|uniref:NAD(P)-dependent oxidoreductase n=1 Tax=Candidatus Uabimicrobium helgolandensis TaxID=3095367 RepID=UPI0035560389